MERAAFLIEATGERIACLLNPESLVISRVAGVRPRGSLVGVVANGHGQETPLIWTGGGTTELTMDLLFDTSLVRPEPAPDNVRELTGPLWRMAENRINPRGFGQVPLVRFVWGKAWNVLGVVAAVAERLEHFTRSGSPRRSWLRLRLLRVDEPRPEVVDNRGKEPAPWVDWPTNPPDMLEAQPYDITGDGAGGTEPLFLVADRVLGTPDAEHALAELNDIEDLLRVEPGTVLRIPSTGTVS